MKRIFEQGHDALSTFGIGKDKSDAHWHNIIYQLIHKGFLRIDITQSAVLKLTEEARGLLAGKLELALAVPRLTIDSGKKSKLKEMNYDRKLFAKLKHLRKSIAQREDVPPFVVYSDATLADMADKLPQSKVEFLEVNGVGQTKLDRYGSEFLAAIAAYSLS